MEDFPTWYPMTVKVKETGETMVIKSHKFDPALFEKINQKPIITTVLAVEKLTPEIDVEPDTKPELVCEPCSKTFKRDQDFKSHNTRFHNS